MGTQELGGAAGPQPTLAADSHRCVSPFLSVVVPVNSNVPYRVRLRLERKRNEDEDAAEKLYTLVTHVPGPVKGLQSKVVETDE